MGAAVVAAIAPALDVGAAVTAGRDRAAAHEADRAALTQITAGLRTKVLQRKAVVDGAAVVMRRESSDAPPSGTNSASGRWDGRGSWACRGPRGSPRRSGGGRGDDSARA